MGRILWLLFVLLLIVAGILVYRVLNAAGTFNTVTAQFAGKCQRIGGVVGAEDIELDRATGMLFISAQDRRPNPSAGGGLSQGGIYLARVDSTAAPSSLTAELSRTFHPHGISLFADPTGRKTLAVVNHPGGGDEVMLFDVMPSPDGSDVRLVPRRTIKDPLMHSLNDVTLVSHEAFYATNDHGSQTPLGVQLENWLLLPRANVVYYDGNVAEMVAEGFNYANGINRNADASEIYVAEATGRTLKTFRRDLNTGALAHIHSLFVPMGLDNIDVDSDGNLWIGAHPKLLDFLAHAGDASKLSPSAVIKVMPAGDATTSETVYVNMGEEISGSSVAVAHANRLFIGAVFDPKYLSCTLP